jgi:predicted DNA-binding transcriptional regulator AlpA
MVHAPVRSTTTSVLASTEPAGGESFQLKRNPMELYRESQAAEFLQVSVKTLQRWRGEGRGPRYRKLSRAVRYARCDLADFIESSVRASTGEIADA